MLENFVKINQFPNLVKQQVGHFNYPAMAEKRPVSFWLQTQTEAGPSPVSARQMTSPFRECPKK